MASAPLSMVYQSEQQIPRLTQSLKDFYRSEDFCDVTLVVGSKRIHAHKVILASFSPFFYQSLKIQGSYHTELPCDQFDENVLKSLVDFCYLGSITVDSVSASQMLSAAITLQIKEVEKLCLTFLRAHQSFVCEISSDVASSRPEQASESSHRVESSGRFSPHRSPNVSTSGRPLSETSSADNTDPEITIKQEQHESGNESDSSFLRRHSSDSSPVSPFRKFPIMTSQGVNVVDVTQMSPTFMGPLYPRPILFPRPTPPQLQLYHPRVPLPSSESESPALQSPEQGKSLKGDLTQKHSSPSLDIVSQSLQAAELPSPVDISPSDPYSCPICKQRYGSSQALLLHMMLHDHVQNPTPTVKKSRKSHTPQKKEKIVIEEDSNGSFSCETCGKSFKDAQSLKFHRYNHVLRHPCNICGKRFSRCWNLQRHKKSHFKMGNWPSASLGAPYQEGKDIENMEEGMDNPGEDEDVSVEALDLRDGDRSRENISPKDNDTDVPAHKAGL
ncbi:hypothetical protein FSP39_022911 [Pinctada imbricata]|uniref:Uncharacterized protein n=1 Tax=Pinctada imbricata TaxID=66713 RepID=A0AA88YMN9_PINIB|nr:hypothetical protein FSP39_006124 [Pinctada imbricata]KAK3103920.1 hypothetical protein FSP39_022911 [Pinctada imbricata]